MIKPALETTIIKIFEFKMKSKDITESKKNYPTKVKQDNAATSALVKGFSAL